MESPDSVEITWQSTWVLCRNREQPRDRRAGKSHGPVQGLLAVLVFGSDEMTEFLRVSLVQAKVTMVACFP